MSDNTSIDIDRQDDFEGRWQKIERISFAVILVLLACTMMGFFGGRKTVVTLPGQAITISYEKYLRYLGTSTVAIHINQPLATDTLHVKIDGDFFNHAEVVSMMPRTKSEASDMQGIDFAFDIGPAHDGTIYICTKSQKAGFDRIKLVINGQPLILKQFIYP